MTSYLHISQMNRNHIWDCEMCVCDGCDGHLMKRGKKYKLTDNEIFLYKDGQNESATKLVAGCSVRPKPLLL